MNKIFRALALCISFIIVFAVVPFAAAEESTSQVVSSESIQGDLNNDGDISVEDVRIALQMAACQLEVSENADMNEDGIISIDDVQLILSQTLKSMNDEEYIQFLIDSGFPRSYTDSLLALHKKYPKWEFIPFITNLTWSEAVEGEHTPHNKQLIENIVSSNLMCSCSSCKGVIQEESNWVSASKEAVEYYLDPRNFLTEEYIFQFETTAYDENHEIDAVETILKSTWMHNSEISYLDAEGNTQVYKENGQAVKYSEAIMKAAKDSGMSAYFLVSKIVQEVGSSTSSYAGGSSGKNSPYNGIYNYYNIGAYTGAGDGLRWANGYMKSKIDTAMYASASTTSKQVVSVPKGAELNYILTSGGFYKVSASVNGTRYSGYVPTVNVTVSTDYGRPWDSPYKSIYYGAKYIYSSFSENQFTGYLQKFNVNPNSDNLYSHEYMANIRAAAAESQKTYKAYNSSGVLSNKIVFSIPVFKDMPNANMNAEDAFKEAIPQVSATATETTVTLSWDAVKNAQYYQVWRFDNATSTYKMIKAGSATSYTDIEFSAGEKRSYKIRAFYRGSDDAFVFSQYSDVFTGISAPATPTGLTAASVDDTSIRLKWNGVSCDGYNIYRYNSISGYALAGTVTDAEFYDTSLTSGSTYLYKVNAFYKSDSMLASSVQTSALSVKTTGKVQNTGVVTVNDSLNIRSSASTSSSVIITAANGQAVLILETLDGWYKVQFTVNGTTYTGYASADYIKLDNVTVTEETCPYAEPTVTLSNGSSGDGVKWLQWHLSKLGYLGESDLDGAFGGMTDTAVRNFQQDKGLTVDGLVGAGTRTALKNSL